MMNAKGKMVIAAMAAVIGLTIIFVPFDTAALSAAAEETAEQRYVRELGLDVEWFVLEGYTSIVMNDRESSSSLCILAGQTENGDWKRGYIDTDTAEIKIPLLYDNSGSFIYGLAFVEQNDRRLIINEAGNEVLDVSAYDSAFPISNRFIGVVTEMHNHRAYDWKCGIIDLDGNVILPCEYSSAGCLRDDLIWSRSGNMPGEMTMSLYDRSGKLLAAVECDSMDIREDADGEEHFIVSRNGKWGAVSRMGEIIVPIEYDFDDFYPPADKITDDNPISLKKEYEAFPCGPLFSGRYALNPDASNNINYAHALLDKAGNRLTDFIYGIIEKYRDGLLIVYDGKSVVRKQGVINQYGTEIVPAVFPTLEIVDSQTCIVGITDGNWENGRLGILKLPENANTRKPPESARPLTVYLNDLELFFDVEPMIADNRTLVPLRKIFEKFGAAVTWIEVESKVRAVRNDVAIELVINEYTALINSEAVALDVPAMIHDGRTFVPLRFIAESLDCYVYWDEALRRVIILTQ